MNKPLSHMIVETVLLRDEFVELRRVAYMMHHLAYHAVLRVPTLLVLRQRSYMTSHGGSEAAVRWWMKGFMKTLIELNEL